MATITDYDYDEDQYVNCPYFPQHSLPRSRLPYHLIKCQKNPNAPVLLVCPFNYLHRVKAEDKHRHLDECEDRQIFVRARKAENGKQSRDERSSSFNGLSDDKISEET